MTPGEPLHPQADYVQVGEPVGAWSKLLASDAALMAKVTALQIAPFDGRDWHWRLIDCAVEHLQAELAGLRQDKERLDWLERHDHALMCWNVTGDPETHEVTTPDNGWTLSLNGPDEYAQGTTAREAIDAGMRRAARSLPRGPRGRPGVSKGIPEDVRDKIVAAIRRRHLRGSGADPAVDREVHWDRAIVDPGGTFLFGPGPYLKVPISLYDHGVVMDEITVRVYAPEPLRRKLAKLLPASPAVAGEEDHLR